MSRLMVIHIIISIEGVKIKSQFKYYIRELDHYIYRNIQLIRVNFRNTRPELPGRSHKWNMHEQLDG